MSETSEQLRSVSETQIVRAFQRALVALYPILRELDCIESDTQLYDPYDRIADALWSELVLNSLKWKYGLNSQPRLPRYGFSGVPSGEDGHICVEAPGLPRLRFTGFIGARSFGIEPFNAVDVVGHEVIPLTESTTFHWARA